MTVRDQSASNGPHAGQALIKPEPWKPPHPLPQRLETQRLVLRFFVAEDAEMLFRAVELTRSSLFPWIPWALSDNRSLVEAIYTIERMRRAREDSIKAGYAGPFDYAIGIFERATGELLGGTGYHRIDAANHDAEIGYWIRADRHRQGIVTEATRAAIVWGFKPQDAGGWGFRRIRIFAAERNAASVGVCDKLGLRRSSHTRQDRWVEGLGFSDTIGWDVLRDVDTQFVDKPA